jgi:hypothetical protein
LIRTVIKLKSGDHTRLEAEMDAKRPRSSSPPAPQNWAEGAPALRELLGVLLEVRAHVEAHGGRAAAYKTLKADAHRHAASLRWGKTNSQFTARFATQHNPSNPNPVFGG